MSCVVYIIQSDATKRYYVGHSEGIEKRLSQHNNGNNKSTKHGAPWHLVYAKRFQTRGEAMKCELQIKNRGVARYLRDEAQPG